MRLRDIACHPPHFRIRFAQMDVAGRDISVEQVIQFELFYPVLIQLSPFIAHRYYFKAMYFFLNSLKNTRLSPSNCD